DLRRDPCARVRQSRGLCREGYGNRSAKSLALLPEGADRPGTGPQRRGDRGVASGAPPQPAAERWRGGGRNRDGERADVAPSRNFAAAEFSTQPVPPLAGDFAESTRRGDAMRASASTLA